MKHFLFIIVLIVGHFAAPSWGRDAGYDVLRAAFAEPPAAARPGVYWYFLDGNSDRSAMTADLESMARSGIGSVVILEVDLGFARGPVPFMSEAWQANFVHAVREAERLGMSVILGTGPGWSGAGGPWVAPENSMQHLVASTTEVTGPAHASVKLPVPSPRKPYFDSIVGELKQRHEEFYRDTFVLAYRKHEQGVKVDSVDEKALYYREPYSSVEGVKAWLPEPPDGAFGQRGAIPVGSVVDLTSRLRADGTLDWDVPAGDWVIQRFGARNNGMTTRPAPEAGYGFETDKFSRAAVQAHLAQYTAKLLAKVGPRKAGVGWTMLHLDSWESGAQNWSPAFRAEFQRRRGYDPLPYFPAYTGAVIDSISVTERFLWDIRLTAQELLIEEHAEPLRQTAHDAGLLFSIEPYDMNPAADLALGAVGDMPMGEFWSQTGFNTAFSCIEAASVAHTLGRPIVAAESFTSPGDEALKLFPATMKNQTDWAFAAGINRIVFHTYAHQPLGEDARPGMTFGWYGMHWHRNQTWWPMVGAYHEYIARCSALLQQGNSVADILYLTPEGVPHVFQAPESAVVAEQAHLPDRRGHNFDGCDPRTLLARARVENGCIAFPGGTWYRVLVLPAMESMTPALLAKIASLVEAGATVIGSPPTRSPSLAGYPQCDEQVAKRALELWGTTSSPDRLTQVRVGAGRLFFGGSLVVPKPGAGGDLYPRYEAIRDVLREHLALPEDFTSDAPVRYTHRTLGDTEFYFVANRTDRSFETDCLFRVGGKAVELWNPVNGSVRRLATPEALGGTTPLRLKFEPYESLFVVFHAVDRPAPSVATAPAAATVLTTLRGPWRVHFSPDAGGPGTASWPALADWTKRSEPGVRYYSGIAEYRSEFVLETLPNGGERLLLDLGVVHDLCRVRLNGRDLGVLWTAPWRLDVTPAVRSGANILQIEVANRWINRLIGDQQPGDKDARTLRWSNGLLGGKPFSAGRHTFITMQYVHRHSALPSSGLLGPVTIVSQGPGE